MAPEPVQTMFGAFALRQALLLYPAIVLDHLRQSWTMHHLVHKDMPLWITGCLCDAVIPRCSTAAGTSPGQAQLRRSHEL